MKIRLMCTTAAAFVVLSGCGNYTGPKTAPWADVDTPWFTGRMIPTVVPDGSKSAGYRQDGDKIEEIYSWFKNATTEATGRSSWMLQIAELSDEAQRIMALYYLCSLVPGAEPCGDRSDAPG